MAENGKKGRVLCVDDEPHVLRALQWLLQKDFDIHTAATAADGLRAMQRHDFDVVVSDQRMPGVTGVEFLRQVRDVAPRAMRILLTGYSDLDAMVRSVNESEVFRFITKPWDIRTLPKLIAEAAEIARTEPVAAPDAGDGGRLPPERAAVSPADANPSPAMGRPGAPRAGADSSAGTPQFAITTVAVRDMESMLLIDDCPEVHGAVTQVVGNTVQVLHAFNLAEALQILNTRPVGVVISEIQVGRMDATRVVKLIRQSLPETVTIVLSDRRDAEIVVSLINQGQVYRFLPKPLKAEFIKVVVDLAMKRHRELKEKPGLQRRYSVEPTAQRATDPLIKPIAPGAPAAPPPKERQASVHWIRPPAPATPPPPERRQAAPPRGAIPADGLFAKVSASVRQFFGA